MSEGAFFQDLAVLMTAAGLVAALFSRLGWPKVIGYILVGIIMGEHTWGGSFLMDVGSTKTIGQLGVVFLMFGMGLSFSSKDLRKIQSVAIPSAIVDTVVMIWIGYTIGTNLFGWSSVQSVFFGVAICDSATTLLAKVIDEMGWSSRHFTKCVLGTSVCEDIICVGAIAVATGFAGGGEMSVGTLASSLGGLLLFFFTVLVFGFIFIPRLLASVSKRKDSEALLLTVLGVCFFVSYFAYRYNFSLALGAFLVGVLGSVSMVRNHLESLVSPLKAMFSAVFFVSIGLMVNPVAIWHNLPIILAISMVVVIGKTFNNAFASLLAGQEIKTAIQNGFAMAQIGEFAFMVAILYAGLTNDHSSPMFTIVVGVSLVTTLFSPMLIRASDGVGDYVVRHLPCKVHGCIDAYRAWVEKIVATNNSLAFPLLRVFALRLGIYSVLMLSVSIICSSLHQVDYSRFSVFFERHDQLFFCVAANVFSLSLMPLVVFAARALGDEIAVVLSGGGDSRWHVSWKQFIRFVVLAAVMGLFFVEWTMINVSIIKVPGNVRTILTLVTICVGFVGWRFFVKAGKRATQRFKEAVSTEERQEGLVRTMTMDVADGGIHRIVLERDFSAIGETVVTMNIRAKTGASVVAVFRDGVVYRNVGPEWKFGIGDVVMAIGDSSQISALKKLLGSGA